MRIVSVSRDEPRPASTMRRRAGDVDAPRQPGALVAVNEAPRSTPVSLLHTRPDASFVTHLIAMAERTPQTRVVRRAAVADVDQLYRAASQNQGTPPTGLVTQRKA